MASGRPAHSADPSVMFVRDRRSENWIREPFVLPVLLSSLVQIVITVNADR